MLALRAVELCSIGVVGSPIHDSHMLLTYGVHSREETDIDGAPANLIESRGDFQSDIVDVIVPASA